MILFLLHTWILDRLVPMLIKHTVKHNFYIAGGLLSLLTLSFLPFGCSCHVTHAMVIG